MTMGIGYITQCKSCHKDIIFIKMASGKNMPCDTEPISYRTAMPGVKGSLTLITPDGKIASGDFDPDSNKYGYTSHFATCPNANQHRRR